MNSKINIEIAEKSNWWDTPLARCLDLSKRGIADLLNPLQELLVLVIDSHTVFFPSLPYLFRDEQDGGIGSR